MHTIHTGTFVAKMDPFQNCQPLVTNDCAVRSPVVASKHWVFDSWLEDVVNPYILRHNDFYFDEQRLNVLGK